MVFGLYMRFIDKIRNTQYSPYYPLTHRGACNPLTVIKITKLELWGFQTASVSYLCWGGGYYGHHLHFYFGKMTETFPYLSWICFVYVCLLSLTTVLYFLFTLCHLPLGSNTVMRSSARCFVRILMKMWTVGIVSIVSSGNRGLMQTPLRASISVTAFRY